MTVELDKTVNSDIYERLDGEVVLGKDDIKAIDSVLRQWFDQYDPRHNLPIAHDYERLLSPYEKRVDFEAARKVFDEDAWGADLKIREQVKRARDSLLKTVKERAESNALTPQWVGTMTVDTPPKVVDILADYLMDVWRKGRDLALKELPENVSKGLADVKRFELGLDICASCQQMIFHEYAFCPTGEGGGIDNSCSPTGEPGQPAEDITPIKPGAVPTRRAVVRILTDSWRQGSLEHGEFDRTTVMKPGHIRVWARSVGKRSEREIADLLERILTRAGYQTAQHKNEIGRFFIDITASPAKNRGTKSFVCIYCGRHRYHLPGQHDQCDHSVTGECVDPEWEKSEENPKNQKLLQGKADHEEVKTGILKAIQEKPNRLTHGATAKNAFFIVGDKIYSWDKWSEIPKDLRRQTIDAHSHSPDALGGNDPTYFQNRKGKEQAHNSSDLTGWFKRFRTGQSGAKSALLYADGTMDVISITERTSSKALKLGEKGLGKAISPSYEEKKRAWEEKGLTTAEYERQKLRTWLKENNFHYAEGIRWATAEQAAALRAKHPEESIRNTAKHFSSDQRDYAGLEPTKAVEYLRNTRPWLIKGVIDDQLKKQARFTLAEHLKGGRTLNETLGNLRDIFEPWIGDPTKITPTGQVGIGFPPGEFAPENILMAYRLENVIRTESVSALAQGRAAVGDEADDYVIGFELSAILDQRTCFSQFTLINTPLGRQTIDSIAPGDIIISGSGKERKVKACWRYAAMAWRKLTFEDGRSVVCTNTHPFWTKTGNGFEWIEAHELENGDIIGTDDSRAWLKRNRLPPVWPDIPPLQQQSAQVLLLPVLSSNAECHGSDMPWMHQDISETEGGSETEVLHLPLLSEMEKQRCLGRAKMPAMRMRIPQDEKRLEAAGSQREVLPPQMLLREQSGAGEERLSYLQEDILSAQIERQPVFSLLSKMFRVAETAGNPAHTQEMEMSHVPEAHISDSQTKQARVYAVLFGDLQDAGHETIRPGTDSSPDIERTKNRLSKTEEVRAFCNGFLSAETQTHAGDRRHLLAPRPEGIGLEKRPVGEIARDRTDADRVHGQQLQTFRRATAVHADHATNPRPTGVARLVSNEPFNELTWAYDLEVEGDHSYIANGLISHNTEICKFADGKKFPRSHRLAEFLLPALHYSCRTIPVFIVTDDLPVEWSTEAELDRIARLKREAFA